LSIIKFSKSVVNCDEEELRVYKVIIIKNKTENIFDELK
jgi:hypothetical protein